MKYLLLPFFLIFFVINSVVADTEQVQPTTVQGKIKALEKQFDGKIGIYAVNTDNNQIVAYRADQRFPVQSTMKLIGVAAALKNSEHDSNFLQERIYYTQHDLIDWYPITRKYVMHGMTIAALAEAAMSYSDDTAINLIMKKLGGPKVVTDFAHRIGNQSFNVEHYDGSLNSNPNNIQDTATPKDMAISVRELTLGNTLKQKQRAQLVTWMRNNTTGYKKIRAGVPIGWVVAEKTGGGYGINNDIGVMWSPLCKPIVLAIYTVQNQKVAKSRDDILASATSIVLDEFAKKDPCFNALFQ